MDTGSHLGFEHPDIPTSAEIEGYMFESPWRRE